MKKQYFITYRETFKTEIYKIYVDVEIGETAFDTGNNIYDATLLKANAEGHYRFIILSISLLN